MNELKEGQTHGTQGYKYGCRCDVCSTAHKVECAGQYQRRLQQMKDGTAPARIKHGRVSTYSGWGCRCTPCTNASDDYNEDMRNGVPIGARRMGVPVAASRRGVWAQSRPIVV